MPRSNAQRVVVELIREAGGTWDGRTRLFKAFYFAHLYYANSAPGILTNWPIVRMPEGPGIQDSAVLFQELIENGYITIERIREGPYPECRYRLTEAGANQPCLDADAQAAVKLAVGFVAPRSAPELSQFTHDHSRSWRQGKDGDILDIYVDLISADEFETEQRNLAHLNEQISLAVLGKEITGLVGGN